MAYLTPFKISNFLKNISVDNFFNNTTNTITVQSDGKILVGGTFTNYGGTTGRNYLIRLNSDGTLDTTFGANAVGVNKFSNTINAVVEQSDGKILVGGTFTNYGAVSGRNRLIRLNFDGTLDSAFNTNAVDSAKFNNTINTITLQSDGKILVGGAFTNYGGTVNRSYLIRLNSDGTLDTTFCINAVDSAKFNNTVRTITTQSDGKILIGGTFTNYGGTTNRNRLIRLNFDGTLDTTFCTNAVDSAKFNNVVFTITAQSDGKILVGGTFTLYAGTTGRDRLIRLNSDGTLDTVFCTNAVDGTKFNNPMNTITVQSDGKILVGGSFINYAGTTGRDRLIRLNSDGTLDSAFNTNAVDSAKFTGNINTISIQSDNKILIGGAFTNYIGIASRSYTVRINSNGTLDTIFLDYLNFNSFIYTITLQSDGKILVGGTFTNYGGTTGRNYLIRLNSDGTLDSAFCANAVDGTKFNGNINTITVQSDGKILVGGLFSNYAGTTGRNYLIRLNSDGTLDTVFCTNAVDGDKFINTIEKITVQSDGKILVGGSFINYAGTTGRNYLIRLNSDGTLDTTFCINAVDSAKFNNTVYTITTQSDGKILVGGAFANYGGVSNRNRLVRLNSTGTLDTTFCTNAVDSAKFNDLVLTITVQSDGQILVGGAFINYGGSLARSYLVRLNSTGTLDSAFITNAVDGDKFNNTVYTITTQSDGKILIGGSFTNYGGTTNRNRLVRLNSSGTLDTTFCTNAADVNKFNTTIFTITLQSDGKILVGGSFTLSPFTIKRASSYIKQILPSGLSR